MSWRIEVQLWRQQVKRWMRRKLRRPVLFALLWWDGESP